MGIIGEIITVCGYVAVLFIFAAWVGELIRTVMDDGMGEKDHGHET